MGWKAGAVREILALSQLSASPLAEVFAWSWTATDNTCWAWRGASCYAKSGVELITLSPLSPALTVCSPENQSRTRWRGVSSWLVPQSSASSFSFIQEWSSFWCRSATISTPHLEGELLSSEHTFCNLPIPYPSSRVEVKWIFSG